MFNVSWTFLYHHPSTTRTNFAGFTYVDRCKSVFLPPHWLKKKYVKTRWLSKKSLHIFQFHFINTSGKQQGEWDTKTPALKYNFSLCTARLMGRKINCNIESTLYLHGCAATSTVQNRQGEKCHYTLTFRMPSRKGRISCPSGPVSELLNTSPYYEAGESPIVAFFQKGTWQ